MPTGYVEGQYLIRVDETRYGTRSEVFDFVDHLEATYKLYFVRFNDLGRVKLLYVKGQHDDVMKAEAEVGVLYIQRNKIHQVGQTQCNINSANQCWGLDRIDQQERLPYSDPLDPTAEYIWGDFTGTSVLVYVADTGIDITHTDYGGRAVWGYTAGDVPTDGDAHGHGTHCAGTVGSDSYGVAKGTTMSAVKVMRDSGFGWTSDIVDGMNWIVEDHNRRSAELGHTAKSVVTKSIGGGGDQAWDDATQAIVDAGAVVVAAAMNYNDDACLISPARVPDVITVAASDVNDVTATFTNWGSCVDIHGPGVDVLSTVPDQGTDYWSGTSMATPHVTGVIARYLDSLDVVPSPQEVGVIHQLSIWEVNETILQENCLRTDRNLGIFKAVIVSHNY